MADFPSSVPSFPTLADGVDYPLAAYFNGQFGEITAIANHLIATATEKTVSSDTLTVDRSRHKVQPQSGTADDIATISGMPDHSILVLFASDAGTDTLTFKHGAGNLSCFGGADIALSHGMVVCFRSGSTVYVAGGGGVTLDGAQTLTNKRITKRVTSETSSATPTINTNNTDIHRITALATNITSMTTNLSGTPTHGQMLCVEITDNGTSRTIAWGASFASTSNAALPAATTINMMMRVLFMWDTNHSTWDCVAWTEEIP